MGGGTFFRVVLMVLTSGHQVRRQPCKLGNLAIFYHAKKNKNVLFLLFLKHKILYVQEVVTQPKILNRTNFLMQIY